MTKKELALAQMLKSILRMEHIVNQYYGQNLQQELAQLRAALQHGDGEDIEQAISDTVDGCGTAMSQLRDLNYELDEFEQTQNAYTKAFNDAIDDFEAA